MTVAFPPVRAVDRYDQALSVYVPMEEPEPTRKLRKKLMLARDLATAALSNPDHHVPQVLDLYQIILEVSVAYVYRLQDLSGLECAVDTCRRLLSSVGALQGRR